MDAGQPAGPVGPFSNAATGGSGGAASAAGDHNGNSSGSDIATMGALAAAGAGAAEAAPDGGVVSVCGLCNMRRADLRAPCGHKFHAREWLSCHVMSCHIMRGSTWRNSQPGTLFNESIITRTSESVVLEGGSLAQPSPLDRRDFFLFFFFEAARAHLVADGRALLHPLFVA